MLVSELPGELPLPGTMFGQPLRVLCFLGGDGMRPRVTETQVRGKFFGGDFCAGFDNEPQRITLRAGVFAVGVVNTPKLVASLRRPIQRRSHAA